MKTIYKLFLIGIIVLVAAECQPSMKPIAPQNSDDKLNFMFITCVVNEDFFIPVQKGMEDAARMMDVNCTFTGTEGVDVAEQAAMVRQAIKDGYDGIVLNIIDPEGFDAVVEEASEAGIPLLGFNIDDHETPNKRIASVNQRLYDAGRKLGREAATFIPDSSEILMTMHDAGVSALEDRLRGAQDGLIEAGKKNIRWISSITGNTVEESAETISSVLKSNPQIKYVLCTGQADTEGAGMAIAQNFDEQGYKAAGFDLSPNILENIKKGYLAFTIDQQPYIQGFYPVIQLALLIRYGIVPSDIDTGAALITAENAESVMQLSQKHFR